MIEFGGRCTTRCPEAATDAAAGSIRDWHRLLDALARRAPVGWMERNRLGERRS